MKKLNSKGMEIGELVAFLVAFLLVLLIITFLAYKIGFF